MVLVAAVITEVRFVFEVIVILLIMKHVPTVAIITTDNILQTGMLG